MDYNYDNLLQQMEHEIDHILINFKQDEKQILQNISQLEASDGHSISTTTIDRSLTERRQPAPATSAALPKATTKSSHDVLLREIDQQLGGFYGSFELRESLKEAHARMNAVVAVLMRVREFVRSQFVRLQIEQLQENVALLRKVFIRMHERMELPDSDEFFDEALSDLSSAERSKKKTSRESSEPSKTAASKKKTSRESTEPSKTTTKSDVPKTTTK